MSDQDDLNDIIDDTPENEAEEVAAEAPAEEAPVEQTEPAEPEPKPEAQPQAVDHMVPVSVVQELRQQLRELKDAQRPRQEPQPAPDFYDDPLAAVKHQVAPIEHALVGQKLQTSRFLAEREFGKDVVQQAYDYFDANPAMSATLLDHASPFHAAVEEFQKAQIAQEVGSDPSAYRERVKAEIRAELLKEMEAKHAADAAANAPSLAGATNIGGRTPQAPVMTSLDDILGG